MQLFNVQLLRSQQAAHREEAGNALAEHRGNGDARNVNADDDNEKEIHNNVQHTGDGEIDEHRADEPHDDELPAVSLQQGLRIFQQNFQIRCLPLAV